ncbi:hypothetical protein [Segetibacter aerophilus]|uniref:Uncharacterized protein n=1 Tax=Segetibacter aerophilus TaxID=670293 RepID=A0A512BJ15_9BACT|nr:hypothetical protein [Segetibacter aerophilus]GEO11865.1 hypothetical protein SAE01_43610 [Segetibacter aerophilus]
MMGEPTYSIERLRLEIKECQMKELSDVAIFVYREMRLYKLYEFREICVLINERLAHLVPAENTLL